MQINKETGSISIIGCGWYGFELAKKLIGLGHVVKGSTTTPAKLPTLAEAGIKPYLLNFEAGAKLTPGDFFDSEILIISIPPKRHSDQITQYPEKIEMIAKLASVNNIKKVIFISSTSVYGDLNTEVTELSITQPQTPSGKLVLQAEQLLRSNKNFTTSILRFSGLVGPGRHPARFFAGKKNIPNGQSQINLIHLMDCIGLTIEIINHQAFGHVFNGSAPHHPQKQVFYIAAAAALNMELPEFIDELKEWKIISSIQVPKLLNYKYKTADWMNWLQAI
ncbi:nucleoside-diphosphate-sugar epimerase [Pedobacter sp. CG_S7]|uniref:SDR family oxidoreductase n=1 Tax=Pedobacter sp. CG_S7 TaxID=3143930 RepID=UPI00339560F2